jgi:nicotinamidase-related amidase
MTQPFFDLQKTFVQPVELEPARTAVVVVDMQYSDASADQGFNVAMDRIYPGSVDYFNERNERLTVPSIRRLLAAARERGVHVVYLTIGAEHRDLRDFAPRTRRWIHEVEERSGVRDIFWCGAPWFAIREELAPVEGDTIVNKTTFGAFNGSDIDDTLRRLGIESLVITGISTNHCVETTARDAADRGYGCVVVDEATADYDDDAQDASLRAFHFNFGRVVRTVDEVIGHIDDGAAV